MRFSQPQEILQTSFSFLKAQLDEDSRRKRCEERNTIKINRKKLPPGFFRQSIEKSGTRKSPIDPGFNKVQSDRTQSSNKSPQTWRKINSHQQLPSSELDHVHGIDLGKTVILKLKDVDKHMLHRKFLQKQPNTKNDKPQTLKTKQIPDCVRPKQFKSKQSSEKFQNNQYLKNLIKQKTSTNSYTEKNKLPHTQRKEVIDMGCTFGKGFNNHVSFSSQNSIVLKRQDNDSPCMSIDEKIQTEQKYQFYDSSDKKEGFQKSTEQSELTQELKSNQNSPVRSRKIRKFFGTGNETPYFQHPKSSSIHWNIFNQDLSSFQDLSLHNSKSIFTAEEKQRKRKYRVNNSSNDHRESKLRKDKKIEDLNLPRIGKTVELLINAKI